MPVHQTLHVEIEHRVGVGDRELLINKDRRAARHRRPQRLGSAQQLPTDPGAAVAAECGDLLRAVACQNEHIADAAGGEMRELKVQKRAAVSERQRLWQGASDGPQPGSTSARKDDRLDHEWISAASSRAARRTGLGEE